MQGAYVGVSLGESTLSLSASVNSGEVLIIFVHLSNIFINVETIFVA